MKHSIFALPGTHFYSLKLFRKLFVPCVYKIDFTLLTQHDNDFQCKTETVDDNVLVYLMLGNYIFLY